MASLGPMRMTLESFLAFDDGTDTRYELIDGELVAMAPPGPALALISINTGSAIKARLQEPCMVLGGGRSAAGSTIPLLRSRPPCYLCASAGGEEVCGGA